MNEHTKEPKSFREMIASGAPKNSWKCDFPHENGLYTNNCTSCGKEFMGHKRRTYCYHCACVNALAGIDDPEAFMEKVKKLSFDIDLEPLLNAVDEIVEHMKGGDA